MKHSIRQRVLDPVTGLKVTKIETVTGELGSGVFDKNDKEIFENDLVQIGSVGCDDKPAKARLFKGYFYVDRAPIEIFTSDELEVVGHVDD